VGWYSWLARYDGADGSFATHECGDEREVFVVQLPPAALLGDKRTAQQPDELVPGARFHVYAATADLPLLHAGCDAAAPAGVSPLRCDGPEPAVTPEPLAGHHFLGEVATDEGGRFRATVWRGVTYCVKEVVAPAGWRLDPAVRCVDAGDRVAEISLSNERLTTAVTGRKFDRSDPSVPVPGAEYVLYVVLGGHDAAAPLGDAWFRDAPVRTPALDGARSFAGALSDADGQLSFTVPAGYRWCALEVRAPAGWRHERRPVCTRGPVHPGDEVVLLLAEDRLPPRLARTGGRGPDVVIGLLGVCSGWLLRRAAQWRATRADREVSTC
jgi:hypothetical protein